MQQGITAESTKTQGLFPPPQQNAPFPMPFAPPPSNPKGYTEIPTIPSMPKGKLRSNTYQDIKLILRDKPTTVFCSTCSRNIVTNIKGRKRALYGSNGVFIDV